MSMEEPLLSKTENKREREKKRRQELAKGFAQLASVLDVPDGSNSDENNNQENINTNGGEDCRPPRFYLLTRAAEKIRELRDEITALKKSSAAPLLSCSMSMVVGDDDFDSEENGTAPSSSPTGSSNNNTSNHVPYDEASLEVDCRHKGRCVGVWWNFLLVLIAVSGLLTTGIFVRLWNKEIIEFDEFVTEHELFGANFTVQVGNLTLADDILQTKCCAPIGQALMCQGNDLSETHCFCEHDTSSMDGAARCKPEKIAAFNLNAFHQESRLRSRGSSKWVGAANAYL